VDLLERHHSPEHLLHCMRSRISWYGKTMGHVKALKEAVRTAECVEEIQAALRAWRGLEVREPMIGRSFRETCD
jgi:hypothetical protein